MKRAWICLAVLPLGCTSSASPPVTIEPDVARPEATPRYAVHLGPAWFSARGPQLGISPEEARTRDLMFTPTTPLAGFWDLQVATEAAATWSALCNDCHGGRRRIAEAATMPPPPADWGTKSGFFFGRERRYEQMFVVIHDGGKPNGAEPSEMPAWNPRLSREQIWALVYYVEYQSGGKRGEFPPGLYPQRMNVSGLDGEEPPVQ